MINKFKIVTLKDIKTTVKRNEVTIEILSHIG